MDRCVSPRITLILVSDIVRTDNYSVLLSHFTRQFSVDPDEIRKYLGVSDDYEDIC